MGKTNISDSFYWVTTTDTTDAMTTLDLTTGGVFGGLTGGISRDPSRLGYQIENRFVSDRELHEADKPPALALAWLDQRVREIQDCWKDAA